VWLSPRALSSRWTRFSPLIMHLRVHLSWIIVVAPPSDITISLVPGAGVPGNGAAALGIIEAVIARFFTGGQQGLAMLFDMILDLSAGHGERIGAGRGRSLTSSVRTGAGAENSRRQKPWREIFHGPRSLIF
jgi:hypothetical protein